YRCETSRSASSPYRRKTRVGVHNWNLQSSLATVTVAISLVEKREELRRVLESKTFASSPKKTKFLEFVAEQTLLGNGDKLNEYLIGLEVYKRGTDFNPQKDPIVRVQAHEIRRLLKKYYEENGNGGPVRIDLPPAHDVPLFAPRAWEQMTDARLRRNYGGGGPGGRNAGPRRAVIVALTCACL